MERNAVSLRALDVDQAPAGAYSTLLAGYRQILSALDALGHPVRTDENYAQTAERAARGMLDMVRPSREIDDQVRDLLARTFPAAHDGMVISRHNACFGICPHHLLPVAYRVSVAYLPDARVLGVSKLSRLIRLLARRPLLQEDLTHELAVLLHDDLASRGSAAFVEGLHLCMAARGVEAHEARVTTSAVRGAFQTDAATRQEFLALVSTPAPAIL